MASRDARVRVVLDTGPAKAALRGLSKEGQATAGRINDKLNAPGGGGFGGGFKVGAGLAAGFKVAKGTANFFGGAGDSIGEVFSGVRADFDEAAGGPAARGQKQARELIAEQFASAVQQSGDTTNAKAVYNSILPIIQGREIARSQIIQDLAGGRGADPEGESNLDKAIGAVVDIIKAGFENIIETFGGGGGR